ncbi:glucose PTS transporter subunit EIIB [Lactiplantibacillus plantarum]
MTKKEYKSIKAGEKKKSNTTNNAVDPYVERATAYLDALGGANNVAEITSCATRLRITVKDESKVASDAVFKANKAVGVVRHGKALQVIVGLDVPQVLESIQELMSGDNADEKNVQQATSQVVMDPISQKAALLMDSMGTNENIIEASSDGSSLQVKIKDIKLVDQESVFKSLNIGVINVQISIDVVTVSIEGANKLAININSQVK